MGFFNNKPEEKRTLEDIFSSAEVKDDTDVETYEGAECEDGVSDEVLKDDKKTKDEKEKYAPINPLDCFFLREDGNEKWLLKLAKVWHYIISVLWFFIGALTFAPVLYLTYKSNQIFKQKKKSIICAVITYATIVCLIAVLIIV